MNRVAGRDGQVQLQLSNVSAIPEPASLALLGLAMMAGTAAAIELTKPLSRT